MSGFMPLSLAPLPDRGEPRYGPDCPVCGCEMEERTSLGLRYWRCFGCGWIEDPAGDHGDRQADLAREGARFEVPLNEIPF